MTERTIKCVDCGAPYTTIRANTKYCKVCSTLRAAEYNRDAAFECEKCQKTFAALPQRSKVCPDCYKPGTWVHDVTGTCSYCGTETDRLIHELISVCRNCAYDPAQRDTLIKSLARKQRERRDNTEELWARHQADEAERAEAQRREDAEIAKAPVI